MSKIRSTTFPLSEVKEKGFRNIQLTERSLYKFLLDRLLKQSILEVSLLLLLVTL